MKEMTYAEIYENFNEEMLKYFELMKNGEINYSINFDEIREKMYEFIELNKPKTYVVDNTQVIEFSDGSKTTIEFIVSGKKIPLTIFSSSVLGIYFKGQ